jgi:YjbE family integral membrane protein
VDLQLVAAALSIVIIDLTLSGDNAVVIGMAAHRLPARQRRLAVVLGAGGAVGLRVIFTGLAALLLDIPLLKAAGGLVLAWIAYKLLREEEEEAGPSHKHGESLADAVRIIVLADVVMSLDNILAVGGASHGNLQLLLFGLALSMPIVMFGSSVLAALMSRLHWLVYLGAAVLAWTSGQMIVEDELLGRLFPEHWAWQAALPLVIAAAVLAASHRWRRAHGAQGVEA